MLRIIFSVVFSLSIAAILFTGCSKTTQPNAEFDDAMNEAYIASVDEDMEMLKASGVNVDSADAVFSLGWNQFIGPMHQSANTSSHAHVAGFDELQNIHPRLGGGVDLGTVYINYSGQQVELNKIQTREGGLFYSNLNKRPGMRGDRHGKNKPKGGKPQGGNRGPGGQVTEIEYIPNTEYQFETSGSTHFNPINVSLTSPPALIDIASHENRDTINVANDLDLTWNGGTTDTKITIRILPHHFPGQGKHPHPRHFSEGIFILLDTNPGQYTVAASDIQNLINSLNTNQIVIMVSQFDVNEIENEGKNIHVVMRNGDRVVLTAE